jgi:hypothetical protein
MMHIVVGWWAEGGGPGLVRWHPADAPDPAADAVAFLEFLHVCWPYRGSRHHDGRAPAWAASLQRGGVDLRGLLGGSLSEASHRAGECGLPASACRRLSIVLGRGRVVYGLAFALAPLRRPPRSGLYGELCLPHCWRRDARLLMSLREEERMFGGAGHVFSMPRLGAAGFEPVEEVWCRCFDRWTPLSAVWVSNGRGKDRDRSEWANPRCCCGCTFCFRMGGPPRPVVRRSLSGALDRASVLDRAASDVARGACPYEHCPPFFEAWQAEDETEAEYLCALEAGRAAVRLSGCAGYQAAMASIP